VLPDPLHLDWPACLNARDLGGLPAGDGRAIAERALVRSDSHSYLTEDGVAAVRAYGVTRVIDLRRATELTQWPSALAADAAYLNLPVQGTDDPEDEATLAELYVAWLDRRPELFAAVLTAIAEAPSGPVVVHCAAGKDRTGVVAAVLLGLLGVSHEDIADDYHLSAAAMAAFVDWLTLEFPEALDAMTSQPPEYLEAPVEAMAGFLEVVDETYGSMAQLATHLGVADAVIDRLRANLLE
jgi:protein-tyrosine phosphatase